MTDPIIPRRPDGSYLVEKWTLEMVRQEVQRRFDRSQDQFGAKTDDKDSVALAQVLEFLDSKLAVVKSAIEGAA